MGWVGIEGRHGLKAILRDAGDVHMKVSGIVLVVCLVCSVALGEYAELEALRRGSGEALKMYGERLADRKSVV